MYRFLSASIVVISSFIYTGCGGGGGSSSAPPTLTSIEITAPKTQLTAGERIELSATGIQSDGTKRFASVTWSVSDETLATIVNGRLEARKAGQVEVIATEVFDKASGRLKISIAPSSPTGINITGFQEGKSQYATTDNRKLSAVAIHPENSKTPIESPVVWSSSDITVATVDNNGVFQARSAGSVTITANWSGFQKSASIVVKEAAVNPIVVKCDQPLSITKSQWNSFRASDSQNGSEWIKFDTNSCTSNLVGLYVRDESTFIPNKTNVDFFRMIEAEKIDGKYQTNITLRDLTNSDKFLTLGTSTFAGAILFTTLPATAITLED